MQVSYVETNNNMREALMKATTYKTGDQGRKAEHCDKLNPEKYVTVLSVWVKPPPMLITRRFEHCDKLKYRNYVTVVDKQGAL